MRVSVNKVVDREVVLAIKDPGSTTNDLLELNHRLDRPQQNNVSDVPCINSSGELVAGREDRRNGLLVVLEDPKVLLTDFSLISGDALAVIRMAARLVLIDQIPD